MTMASASLSRSSLLINFGVVLNSVCFPFSMNPSSVSVSVYGAGFSFCLCVLFGFHGLFRKPASISADGYQGRLHCIENMKYTYHPWGKVP